MQKPQRLIVGQPTGQAPAEDFQGCFRGEIVGGGAQIAEKVFCQGVSGHGPAVGLAPAVDMAFEAGNGDIGLHLQRRACAFQPFSAEGLTHVVGTAAALLNQRVQPPFRFPGQAVVHPGVEIIALTAIIGQVSEQLPADEARLAVEELGVNHPAFRGQSFPPFPGAFHPILKPHVPGRHFLRGESGNFVGKQGQKPDFLHGAGQIRFAAQGDRFHCSALRASISEPTAPALSPRPGATM